ASGLATHEVGHGIFESGAERVQPELPLELRRQPEIVTVAERDPWAAGQRGTHVAGDARTELLDAVIPHRRAEALDHCRGVVERAVVHDDDLARWPRLRENALDGLADQSRSITARYDDGDIVAHRVSPVGDCTMIAACFGLPSLRFRGRWVYT